MKNKIKIKIPDYFIFSDNFKDIKNYTLFTIDNEKYIFLKNDYFKSKITNYIKILLMWDCIIILTILFLYYLTIRKNLIKEHQIDKTNEIALFTLKHKLHNYLAGQRLNIEILKNNFDNIPNSLKRIDLSNKKLNEDLKNSFDFITNFKNKNLKVEYIQIDKEINQLITTFVSQYPNSQIRKNLLPFKKLLFKNDIEFLLYLIFDNVFKYSKKHIHIKTKKIKLFYVLIIRNDIDYDVKSGLGVGLRICEFLASKNNLEIKTKIKSKHTTILIFKPNFVRF